MDNLTSLNSEQVNFISWYLPTCIITILLILFSLNFVDCGDGTDVPE
jgi:hypothetical protein